MYSDMDTMVLGLKIIGGFGMLALFVFLIFYSINESPTRFIKYLLAYLVFFVAIGFLFYLFSQATLYIAILAGLGWIVLIVMGSRGGNDSTQTSDDMDWEHAKIDQDEKVYTREILASFILKPEIAMSIGKWMIHKAEMITRSRKLAVQEPRGTIQ